MNIISDKNWEPLEKMNQVLIQKWEALKHAWQEGEAQEILSAEMAYLSALQNVVSVVQIAVSPVNRKSA